MLGAVVVATEGVELTTGLVLAAEAVAFGAVTAAVVVGADATGVLKAPAAGLAVEAAVWDVVAALIAALPPFEAALDD